MPVNYNSDYESAGSQGINVPGYATGDTADVRVGGIIPTSVGNPLPVRPEMVLQTLSVLANTVISGGTGSGHTWDVDLRSQSFNGYMELVTEGISDDLGNGLTGFSVTVVPINRNVADTAWLSVQNASAITIEDIIDMTAGNCGSWDISRAFELLGGINNHFGMEGLRFYFGNNLTGHNGTITTRLMGR